LETYFEKRKKFFTYYAHVLEKLLLPKLKYIQGQYKENIFHKNIFLLFRILWNENGDLFPCLSQLTTSGFQSQSRSQIYFTTDSQSVCLGIKYPCGICNQILLPVGMLLSEICGLVSIGRPLWWEDGSAICGVITQWSESLRTQNHTLLSHLRLECQFARLIEKHVKINFIKKKKKARLSPKPVNLPLDNRELSVYA
jgi:hypothetical protein